MCVLISQCLFIILKRYLLLVWGLSELIYLEDAQCWIIMTPMTPHLRKSGSVRGMYLSNALDYSTRRILEFSLSSIWRIHIFPTPEINRRKVPVESLVETAACRKGSLCVLQFNVCLATCNYLNRNKIKRNGKCEQDPCHWLGKDVGLSVGQILIMEGNPAWDSCWSST